MIRFPNCKINIGLRIVSRRADGYHNIETVMVPVPWCDILEIVPSDSGADDTLTVSGRHVDCPPEKNLVMRACNALRADGAEFPPVKIYLRKIIPDGAGLGGGSSDASTTLLMLNDMFALGYSKERLAEIAASLGADCPFFIYNRPMLATETGTTLTETRVDLSGLTIVIAKPRVSVPTAAAYRGVTPAIPTVQLDQLLTQPPHRWAGEVVNDFETTVFAAYPQIAAVKQSMADAGAIYTAMSGSGSAVFGLWEDPPAEVIDHLRATLDDTQIFSAVL